MATFTMELNEVLDFTTDIGLDEYPIFDEAHREVLNRKITRHFWNQEIGQETISMFRLAMSRLMDEVMPYYNKMYEFDSQQIDPLSTVNIKNTSASTSASESASGVTATNKTDAKSRAVASEMPQQSLRANADYATSAQDNISENAGESESAETRNDTTDGTVESNTTGYNGHAPELIRIAREAVINVDLMILNEIEKAGIFMMITSITDSFTNTEGFYNGFY